MPGRGLEAPVLCWCVVQLNNKLYLSMESGPSYLPFFSEADYYYHDADYYYDTDYDLLGSCHVSTYGSVQVLCQHVFHSFGPPPLLLKKKVTCATTILCHILYSQISFWLT